MKFIVPTVGSLETLYTFSLAVLRCLSYSGTLFCGVCIDGPSRTGAGNAMGTGGGVQQTRTKEPGGVNSKNHGVEASKNNSSSLSEDAANTT